MHCLVVSGVAPKYLAIKCGRTLYFARLMQGKRLLQKVLNSVPVGQSRSEIRRIGLRNRHFVFMEIIAVIVFRADILGFRDRLIMQDKPL